MPCINENEGWVRIDTMSGGGSGGASTLNDLLDVTITGAASGQYLQLQASGQWQNVDLTADVESANGKTGVVVLVPSDIGVATDAQGAKADTALQPGDNMELVNNANYLTASTCRRRPLPRSTARPVKWFLLLLMLGLCPTALRLLSYPRLLGRYPDSLMADLQSTDQFLVNRSDSTATVTAANLMATILDDDLMLVNWGTRPTRSLVRT